MRTRRMTGLLSALLLVSTAAMAATYPEIAEQRAARRAPPSIGYRERLGGGAMPYGGMQLPIPLTATQRCTCCQRAAMVCLMPARYAGAYGQVNAASDPFFIWGLRTQGMYVPWSTPMSSWTNAQNWDWWRRRSGDSGPQPPLW